MTVYVAKKDSANPTLPVLETRAEVSVLHVDESSRTAWLAIPEDVAKQLDSNDREHGMQMIWNEITVGDRPTVVALAPLVADNTYRVLARLGITEMALQKQIPFTPIKAETDVPHIEWPANCANLKEVVDAASAVKSGNDRLSLLRAVARVASNSTRSGAGALPTILESITVTNLTTPSGFARFMAERTALFTELRKRVRDRRLLFLVGGYYSYLPEFVDGFNRHGHHRGVAFDVKVLEAIRAGADNSLENLFKDQRCKEVNCLFAALAYCALNATPEAVRGDLEDIFDRSMAGNPRAFAGHYLRPTVDYDSYWACVRHFLDTLSRAATRLHPPAEITIFLPFTSVQEALNERLVTPRHFWEAVGALRDQLRDHPDDCPALGVVLSGQTLHVADNPGNESVADTVLRIPPLSREELAALLTAVLRSVPSATAVAEYDRQTGGAPWFALLLLRCLAWKVERASSIIDWNLVEDAASMARAALETVGAFEAIPSDLRSDIDSYREQIVTLFKRTGATLEGRRLFNAWSNPAGVDGTLNGITTAIETWLESGLTWTEAPEAPDSLASLRNYPAFRFRRAGQLPLLLFDRIQQQLTQRGRKRA